MKPTFITDEASQDPAAVTRLCRRFGIESVELRSVEDRPVWSADADRLRAIRSWLDGDGLAVCCLDTPVFKCAYAADPRAELEKLDPALDVAAALGAPMVRVFTYWLDDQARPQALEAIADHLREAGSLADDRGIVVGIENGRKTMHRTGGELAALLDALGRPERFAAVWDPGNCIFGHSDPDPIRNGYPALAGRIGHVHLKDPVVHSDGRRAYVALGEGSLNVDRQLDVLRRDGFAGWVSLETHWRPDGPIDEGLLDHPYGSGFTTSGYDATAQSLAQVVALLDRPAAAG